MLHRATLGSLERVVGILIENFAGAFPACLAFEQAAVVPVSNDFNNYAKKVDEALKAVKIRSNAYLSEDNMRSKIKVITKEHKTPYILIVGENEQKEGTVSVRFRQSSGLEQITMKIEEFIAYVQEKNAEKGTNI